MITHALGHASADDRRLFREQLALLLERYPARSDALLSGLAPVERRIVQDIVAIRGQLAAAIAPPAPATDTAGDLLRVDALPDGGRRVYIGRPDGVYTYTVTAAGGVTELRPHAPWSLWTS